MDVDGEPVPGSEPQDEIDSADIGTDDSTEPERVFGGGSDRMTEQDFIGLQ